MYKPTNSTLTAVVAFFMIIVFGESVALLMDYSNNTFLQQYVSANVTSVVAEVGILGVIAFGLAFLIFRRASSDSVTLEEPQSMMTASSEIQLPISTGRMKVLSDTRHLFVRSLKKLLRNPILLFFSLFQPIIFIVLFTQLFSAFARQLPAGLGNNYTTFAVAGIVLQNGFSSAFQSGTSMVDDLRSGFLVKMLATPVSRTAILLGRISTDMFRMVVQSSIIFLLAALLGATPDTGIPGYLVMLATIAFFGLAWSGISLSIGLKTKSAETVFGIAGTLTFPLLFMSTALVPVGLLPNWMATVSTYNPISITVDAIRATMMANHPYYANVNVPGTILTAFGVIALIGVVTLSTTLYLFKKVIS